MSPKPITVRQLSNALAKLPPDALLAIMTDAGGRAFPYELGIDPMRRIVNLLCADVRAPERPLEAERNLEAWWAVAEPHITGGTN